jgi:hypothetical protein
MSSSIFRGFLFAGCFNHFIAGYGLVAPAVDLDRHAGPDFGKALVALVAEIAHASPGLTRDNYRARFESTPLHQHSGHAAGALGRRFEHPAFDHTVGV